MHIFTLSHFQFTDAFLRCLFYFWGKRFLIPSRHSPPSDGQSGGDIAPRRLARRWVCARCLLVMQAAPFDVINRSMRVPARILQN